MVEGPSIVELLVRLVFSLGIVIGLLVLAAKVARRGNGGRGLRLPGLGTLGGRREPALKVLERQSLTRHASLALVQVGERTMVVGVTEQGISLLADEVATDTADDDEEPAADEAPAAAVTPISAVREAKGTLPLAPGNAALDAAVTPDRPTRMSFVDALRELTVRSA